ncbi:MAG: GNAT family N-acetyltransferase [Solirubrobacteraceae bacterium]
MSDSARNRPGERGDGVRIRPAERDDVELVLAMIRELADYERARERAVGSEDLLRDALFGEHPAAEAVIAELDDEPVGFALFFGTFSTWLCRPGLYLEDLFVRPAHRRGGIGRALLSHVARIALERGCARLDWSVLGWNEPALEFYRALGAEQMHEWAGLRLEGESLERAAGERTLLH